MVLGAVGQRRSSKIWLRSSAGRRKRMDCCCWRMGPCFFGILDVVDSKALSCCSTFAGDIGRFHVAGGMPKGWCEAGAAGD